MSKKVKSIDGLVRHSAGQEMGQFDDNQKIIKRHSRNRKAPVVKNTTFLEELVERTEEPEVVVSQEVVQQKVTQQEVVEQGARELGDFALNKSVEELAKTELEFSSDEMEKEIKNKEKQLKKDKKKAKKAKKKWSKKRKVLTVLGILLILIGGAVGALLYWGNDVISRITNGESGIWDAVPVLEQTSIS